MYIYIDFPLELIFASMHIYKKMWGKAFFLYICASLSALPTSGQTSIRVAFAAKLRALNNRNNGLDRDADIKFVQEQKRLSWSELRSNRKSPHVGGLFLLAIASPYRRCLKTGAITLMASSRLPMWRSASLFPRCAFLSTAWEKAESSGSSKDGSPSPSASSTSTA